MTQKYPYYHYIPHLCVIRVIIVGPLAISRAIAEFIYSFLDRITELVSISLPIPYIEKWVEFDALPPRRQQQIEKLERMASQLDKGS